MNISHSYIRVLIAKIKAFLDNMDGCFSFIILRQRGIPQLCFIYNGSAYFVDCIMYNAKYAINGNEPTFKRMRGRRGSDRAKTIKALRNAGANYMQVYSLEEFVDIFLSEIANGPH